MVVTYLLILTGVVGYACWRGYQLEVWVGELSKSVGQLANSVTKVECKPALNPLGASEIIGELSALVMVLEKLAKKPRGRK